MRFHISGSPSFPEHFLFHTEWSCVEFIMTFDAQHHCLASPLDHLSFPRGFAFQVSQFTDMMYFYLTASDAAPFALRCEQASTQFMPALVHPRFRHRVHLPIL